MTSVSLKLYGVIGGFGRGRGQDWLAGAVGLTTIWVRDSLSVTNARDGQQHGGDPEER